MNKEKFEKLYKEFQDTLIEDPLVVTFDDEFYKRCDTFISLLQQWGKIHNLTASLSTSDIEENILDSIYPLAFIDAFKSFADVGTGAGYPGMLLAIARPDIKAVLIEARVKRVAFLNFVKSALKLNNLEIIKSRVEDVELETFDLVTSRAVTNTSLLLDLTSNISDENTSYLFYKGSLCQDEIKDAKVQNFKVKKIGEHRNYLYIQKKGLINGN